MRYVVRSCVLEDKIGEAGRKKRLTQARDCSRFLKRGDSRRTSAEGNISETPERGRSQAV